MILSAPRTTMEDEDQLFRAARRAAVAALAAELGHELQGPLNLFRLATDRAGRGQALDAEDLTLLGEELARLGRLGARLRQLAQQPLVKQPHPPHEIVERALGSGARAMQLELELDLPEPALYSISCDAGLLGLALRELIDNALAARASRAGVRFSAADPPGFCVWDDGAGFPPGDDAFAWGVSSKAGAAGLGLTLAFRAARAHGFGLNIVRTAARTEVHLSIPARELRAGTSGSTT